MSNVTLSTIIDSKVKRATTQYCRKKGLKMRYVVEQALIELLEDEIDLAAYQERRREDTIPLEKILKEHKI